MIEYSRKFSEHFYVWQAGKKIEKRWKVFGIDQWDLRKVISFLFLFFFSEIFSVKSKWIFFWTRENHAQEGKALSKSTICTRLHIHTDKAQDYIYIQTKTDNRTSQDQRSTNQILEKSIFMNQVVIAYLKEAKVWRSAVRVKKSPWYLEPHHARLFYKNNKKRLINYINNLCF